MIVLLSVASITRSAAKNAGQGGNEGAEFRQARLIVPCPLFKDHSVIFEEGAWYNISKVRNSLMNQVLHPLHLHITNLE